MGTGRKPPTKAALRKFGVSMAIGLSVASGLLWWRGATLAQGTVIWPWTAALAALVLLAALVSPHVLAPIEKVSAAIMNAFLTGVTYVVLVLTFFFVMTPMGLLVRILRKDLLGLKFEKEKQSYWVPVEQDGPASRPFRPF